MKNFLKFIFTILAVLTVSGVIYASSFGTSDPIISNIDYDTVECKYDQCHAIAKSTDERCKHCVSNDGDIYCWQHD